MFVACCQLQFLENQNRQVRLRKNSISARNIAIGTSLLLSICLCCLLSFTGKVNCIQIGDLNGQVGSSSSGSSFALAITSARGLTELSVQCSVPALNMFVWECRFETMFRARNKPTVIYY